MADIRIAARLAINGHAPKGGAPASGGYHGRTVVVRALSSSGFVAECGFSCPEGSIVRLKLPCVGGVALARVTGCRGDRLSADFVNPFALSRIATALGMDLNRLAAA